MKTRNVFIITLCLFMAGCFPKYQVSKSESEARDLMARGEALENAKAYAQALKEYVEVAERYPSTSYYKRAVWKAALLNMYPDNPEISDTAARDWLQVYLGLPLSTEEKETATVCISMLDRIHDLKAELTDIKTEKERLAGVAQKQADEMEAGAQRVKELEAELQKMKAVDVQMHLNRADKNADKPSPLLQKASQPKEGTHKKESPDRRNVLKTDQGFYPYAVQIGAYRNKKDSMREAMILRDKGDSVCVSHAQITGKGEWYRVLVGFYRTPEEAQKAALELKKRQYRNAFAVRQPFAVEIGVFPGDEKLKDIESQLISNGYSAYTLPVRDANNKFRLLIGAFYTEKEAATLTENLQKNGFKPKVVRR